MTVVEIQPSSVTGTGVTAPRGVAFPLTDPRLAHQIQLLGRRGSRREFYARCNCGWVGLLRRPEVLGALQTTLAEYQAHLATG